ncbi:EamA family transporter [Paraferrimonas haliotis]|uniref:4-amino-4-deoxy-L-arabinose-phosphoundecaprenol flippase subunit ArnE n=1 Tax=Paraferrimonas haliotis TaxID=2013866 RepID=A0AA37WWE1_9GAMM|nr:EamA family transporter [Paraferrimonas haliotis]GLS82309.1 putative 4-amino-4-deoxy-L-arabinose-phosphoundecaprenol flippase subunit ArnE [Paraferrimonas haliotis]
MVSLWLVLSIACTCLGQVAQKLAVQRIQQLAPDARWGQKLLQPWLVAAIALLGLGAVFWLLVLQSWPVGIAYPFLALNFIVMLVIAKCFFKEDVTSRRWLGALLITAGVACMGLSL